MVPPLDLREQLQSALGAAYALERELGGGGMSRVFLATETALGRTVVIKVLPPELRGVVSVERFRREVRLAARLRHPHVVPLLAAGDADGVPYYTMPFVEGESLRGRLSRNGALSVSEAVRLLRDVADALAYAHGQGLVHRDLKPENILLERGHAVVTDFGIAKALSNAALDEASDENGGTLTTAGLAVGTPAYMAPEQALADPAADHRVDLYALGCIAYEILAGTSPFAASSPQAVVAAHIAATPTALAERRPDVPSALARLVMRLLEKRPQDRPANAEEVVYALDRPEIHESPLTGMASSATTVRETRSPRIAVVLLAMVVIVAAGVLIFRARTRHESPVPSAAGDSTPTNVAAHNATAAITSIAVLPLVNVGGDTAQEYFADGMTDELTGALARVAGLRVASRTSAFAFKGQRDTDVREIGRRLNVDAVLEGTVRRAGGRLKVGAQLTSVRDGLSLWSDSYERRSADVFAVQEEIARAITGALERQIVHGQLGAVVPARKYDLAAYDLLLRAEYLSRQQTESSLRRSIPLYEAAVARDSTLAPRAWFGVATTWAWLSDDWVAPRVAWPRSKAACLRALAADSTFEPARSALGVVLLFQRDFAGAERMIRTAMAHDSSSGNYDLTDLMLVTGRFDSAVATMRRAQRIDPLDPQTTTRLGDALAFAGRDAGALAQYRAALELERDYPFALVGIAALFVEEGRAAEALPVLERMPAATTRSQVVRARAYIALGRRADAQRIVRELETQSRQRYVQADGIASIYAALGERDSAFTWLDRASNDGASGILYLRIRREWDSLRSDPRFAALIRKAGLP